MDSEIATLLLNALWLGLMALMAFNRVLQCIKIKLRKKQINEKRSKANRRGGS